MIKVEPICYFSQSVRSTDHSRAQENDLTVGYKTCNRYVCTCICKWIQGVLEKPREEGREGILITED